MTDGRRVAVVVRTLALLAAAAIAVYAVTTNWSTVHDALAEQSATSIVVSLLGALAGLAAGGLAWRALLNDLGMPMPAKKAAHVFFVGQLAKYLPGGFWPVVAQMELGHEAGATRQRTATTAVVAMGVNVTTGLAVAVALLPFASSDGIGNAIWLLALLPVGLVLLHPRVLTKVVNRALRLLRQPALDVAPSWTGVLTAVVWSLVGWLCYGVHLYALVDPVAEPGHHLGLLSIGAYALAWTVGFLAVFAPAGAGAREGMLVVLLATAMPTAVATTVALVSRVIMTVGDLAWAGVGALLGRATPE